MQRGFHGVGRPEGEREALERLAKSGDAQRLFAILKNSGQVQQAAKAAAQGDAEQLTAMVSQLMNTREGARLIERLRRQAEESGLS